MNTENKIPDSASEFGGGLFMMKNYYLTQKYSHAAHLFEKKIIIMILSFTIIINNQSARLNNGLYTNVVRRLNKI